MKNLKTYKLFVEALAPEPYENIMKDMADNDEIDVNKVQNIEKNIEDLKEKILLKKEELEKKLENLEQLEVETFTEDNQKLVEKRKEQIGQAIEVLKKEIEGYEATIQTFKDNIDNLKK
jgi:hypothetical protein